MCVSVWWEGGERVDVQFYFQLSSLPRQRPGLLVMTSHTRLHNTSLSIQTNANILHLLTRLLIITTQSLLLVFVFALV